MSEQEHIYEYEFEQERARAENIEDIEISDKGSAVEELDIINGTGEVEDLDEIQGRRVSHWPARVLVAALAVSFLACLAALWLSGTLLSAPDHLLPLAFLQMMAAHRLLVLLVPAACLVTCYGILRSLTREIMVVPERYLDERQKMLRDQAHRSAFKFIKFACLLIPCGFILPHLPWFNPPAAPVAPVPLPFIVYMPASSLHMPNGTHALTLHNLDTVTAFHFATFSPWSNQPVLMPATTTEIAVAGCLLLLCLLLIVSALPMAVLAWKGRD